MKCVQSVVNAKIVRVPDDKAERMVASKSWFYVAKHLCKESKKGAKQ